MGDDVIATPQIACGGLEVGSRAEHRKIDNAPALRTADVAVALEAAVAVDAQRRVPVRRMKAATDQRPALAVEADRTEESGEVFVTGRHALRVESSMLAVVGAISETAGFARSREHYGDPQISVEDPRDRCD
jgi:hypothetical protein